jgi:hypothetical protein
MPSSGHDADNERGDERPLTDQELAERKAHDPAHRREMAAEFRRYVLDDTVNMRKHNLASTLEQQMFIPRCCLAEDVLFRFALSRKYDFETASRRFYDWCAVMHMAETTTMTEYNDAVAHGAGGAHVHDTPGHAGVSLRSIHVAISVASNANDKTMVDAHRRQSAMWQVWRQATSHGYMAQTLGTDLLFYFKDAGGGKRDPFVGKMVAALPMKTHRVYMCDASWSIRNLLWPAMKFGFSKKIRERVVWLTDEPSKDGTRKAYHELFEDHPACNISDTVGGTFVYDREKIHDANKAAYGVAVDGSS